MRIEIDDAMLDYVAELSRIKLMGEEREGARRDLTNMLAQVEVLSGVDVTDVEPITHPQPITHVLRADRVEPSLPREEILAGAPAQSEGSFQVPRTVE